MCLLLQKLHTGDFMFISILLENFFSVAVLADMWSSMEKK